MKLFLFIALIALVAVAVIAMQRTNARVTTIERRKERRADPEGEDES